MSQSIELLRVKGYFQSFIVANSNGYEVNVDDSVIVETPIGIEFATVTQKQHFVGDASKFDVYKFLSIATHEDKHSHEQNMQHQSHLKSMFKEEVEKLNLNMQFVDALRTHDRDKVTFFYTAEGRIDFRELVRNLAQKLKCRVELRQITERERAKMVGGVGPCGYQLCCSNFLNDFALVNVKMAKMQQLSFNLQRVTGVCERLLCCLRYEYDQYIDMRKGLPDVGHRIELEDGRKGRVRALQLLKEEITIQMVDDSIEMFDFETFFTLYKKPIKKPREEGQVHHDRKNQ